MAKVIPREDAYRLFFKLRNKEKYVHPVATKDQMRGVKEGEANIFLVEKEIHGP